MRREGDPPGAGPPEEAGTLLPGSRLAFSWGERLLGKPSHVLLLFKAGETPLPWSPVNHISTSCSRSHSGLMSDLPSFASPNEDLRNLSKLLKFADERDNASQHM